MSLIMVATVFTVFFLTTLYCLWTMLLDELKKVRMLVNQLITRFCRTLRSLRTWKGLVPKMARTTFKETIKQYKHLVRKHRLQIIKTCAPVAFLYGIELYVEANSNLPMTRLLVLSVPIFLIILYSMAYYFYPDRQPTLFLWLQFLIILAIFLVVVVIEVVLVMRATELRISTFLPLVIACINVYGAFALVPVVATIGQRLGLYGRLLVGILAFLSLETLLNLTIGLVEVLPMANGYDFAHQDEWSVFFTIMAYGIHRVFSSPLPPKPGTSIIPIGLYFVGVIVNVLILSLMVSSISTSKA